MVIVELNSRYWEMHLFKRVRLLYDMGFKPTCERIGSYHGIIRETRNEKTYIPSEDYKLLCNLLKTLEFASCGIKRGLEPTIISMTEIYIPHLIAKDNF